MIWRIMQFEEGVLLTLAGGTLQELHNFQIIQKPRLVFSLFSASR